MVEAVGKQHESSFAVDAGSQRLHQPGRGIWRPHQSWRGVMGKPRLAFAASSLDQVLKDGIDHAQHFKRKSQARAMAIIPRFLFSSTFQPSARWLGLRKIAERILLVPFVELNDPTR